MAEGVQFDEDKMGALNRAYSPSQEQTKMTRWFIKHGLASSSGSAQTVMIAVVIINAIIIFILVKTFL